jgi:hypothetical protein
MTPGQKAEPPSCLQPPIFLIGRDSRGNWVAQEQSGARGGLFVDRAGALKFARSENGNRPHAVVWVSGPLELNMAPARTISFADRHGTYAPRQRQIA